MLDCFGVQTGCLYPTDVPESYVQSATESLSKYFVWSDCSCRHRGSKKCVSLMDEKGWIGARSVDRLTKALHVCTLHADYVRCATVVVVTGCHSRRAVNRRTKRDIYMLYACMCD